VPKTYIGEKTSCLTSGAKKKKKKPKTGDPEDWLDPYFSFYTNINSKWIKVFNVETTIRKYRGKTSKNRHKQ
jgi:hypothetical protein